MRTKEQRKRHVQYLARTVEPLSEWGHGPGRGHTTPQTRRKKRVKGSGGQKYLVARIARDRPDVLERMKKGQFLSVRQAAIAARIIKNPIELHASTNSTDASVPYAPEEKSQW